MSITNTNTTLTSPNVMRVRRKLGIRQQASPISNDRELSPSLLADMYTSPKSSPGLSPPARNPSPVIIGTPLRNRITRVTDAAEPKKPLTFSERLQRASEREAQLDLSHHSMLPEEIQDILYQSAVNNGNARSDSSSSPDIPDTNDNPMSSQQSHDDDADVELDSPDLTVQVDRSTPIDEPAPIDTSIKTSSSIQSDTPMQLSPAIQNDSEPVQNDQIQSLVVSEHLICVPEEVSPEIVPVDACPKILVKWRQTRRSTKSGKIITKLKQLEVLDWAVNGKDMDPRKCHLGKLRKKHLELRQRGASWMILSQ